MSSLLTAMVFVRFLSHILGTHSTDRFVIDEGIIEKKNWLAFLDDMEKRE